MAPKKGNKQQKMALSDFLVDDSLGSWADEMDNLPTAPSGANDGGPRGGRDDYLSSRPDRGGGFPPREDLPLPTSPPYTAFVGNMAFDLSEQDLEAFFDGLSVKSVKVIKDRDDRPKGFGYVEFGSLDDLKGALAKSGTPLAGRTVRISVAEPPKERDGRPGFGGGDRGGSFDDTKFESDWRSSRPGPLPPAPRGGGGFGGGDRGGFERREGGGGGFERGDRPPRGDREPLPPSAADTADAWRSSRPARPAEPERKRSNFGVGAGSAGAADNEETWSKGSRFQPSTDEPRRGGFGGGFRRDGQREREREEQPPSAAESGETWRRGPSRQSTSPTSSTPPTPSVGGRRPLNLLPRTGAPSGTPSPLASPSLPGSKANPFGAAKPVDVSAREAAVEAKIERQAAHATSHHPMSRTGSRTASQRGSSRLNESTTSPATSPRPAHASPKGSHDGKEGAKTSGTGGVRREGFSFAAAAGKEDKDAEGVAQSLSEVTI
ncbi:unnamed protein product [Peniophora sp. CBMAI 1063]|nr:unnamed protein product [Peniophora sp. CBMAI 1063]